MGENNFTARAYQMDLFEKAVKENTIIYLPTGTGKTFIAVLLIKQLSGDIRKPFFEGGKRSIFIVNTVPLVTQQSEYVARHTGLICKGYSGDMQIDYWDKNIWSREIEHNQVLVMTAQIFVDIISHGYLELRRVNLIIFDECHRAVGDHPMRQAMQLFETCAEHPRVLALSATLLNANIKLHKVEETIRSLEVTFHAKIATLQSYAIVQNYATKPNEYVVLFTPLEANKLITEVEEVLNDMISILNIVQLPNVCTNNDSSDVFQPKSKNSKLICVIEDIRDHVYQTGVYGGSKAVLLHMIQLEHIKKYNNDMRTICVLDYMITQLTKIRKFFHHEMEKYTELECIHKFSSDKVRKLFTILKNCDENKLKDQKFCCIIFVKRRFTAKVLYHVLQKLHESDNDYKFLLPEYVIGYSNNPFKNSREVLCISKWNKESLIKFRNGRSNCIVATDVVDEGIDIPACTLIVRFDAPMDYRAYVQSKGRARDSASQYALLVSSNDKTFPAAYATFKQMEVHLEEILVGKTDKRLQPSSEEIKTKLYSYSIDPYVVQNESGGTSVLTEQNAISMINRYCSSLYRSKFIVLSPTWVLHKISKLDESLYKVTLKLPSVSPLSETIVGDEMPSIDEAKRSVAMKTCIALHKMGELSNYLLPITGTNIPKNTDHLFPHWDDEAPEVNKAFLGTNRMKRKHDLVHSEALYSAFPKANAEVYLHVLDVQPKYQLPTDNRRLVFYNLLNDRAGYAILSSKKMPQIPSFPIFMNVGDLRVNVIVNHSSLKLNEEQILSLSIFHSIVFNQALQLVKSFMVFDKENLDNCFLIVPVNSNWDINWNLIEQYKLIQKIPPSVPLNVQENYKLALVTPSYRAVPSVYIVTDICNMAANSQFPTEDYSSYVSYFKERHELTIQDESQPMLEVKLISPKINCIRPRKVNTSLTKRKRGDVSEDFEEHLVPELCHKYTFSALYWLKATYLPSVLHRINQLLVAEDLRVKVALEANLGRSSLPLGETWEPLIIVDKVEETEPILDYTLDDTLPEASLPEPELVGPEIDVLSSETKLYSWTKEQEPPNLDKDIEQIQIIDIEYYYQFMNVVNETDKEALVKRNRVLEYSKKPTVKVSKLNMLHRNNPRGPSPVDIAQALTSKMGHDAFDLERLETLGDAFLKFAVSLYLFDCFPQYNEGQLTSLKMKLLGNRNLYYCGKSKGVPGRIKVDEFVPNSNFIIPATVCQRDVQTVMRIAEVSPSVLYELEIPAEERLSGYVSHATLNSIKEKILAWDDVKTHSSLEHFLGMQTVPDKVVADAVEALIGVYLKELGAEGAVKFLTWLDVLPKNIDIKKVFFQASESPRYGEGNINIHMPWANYIEEKIGYKFKDRAFLLQAFTHPSYTPNNITPCYQRLEFLGDAILDFLITLHIYETFEDLNPGELTDLRSALVNNITFACLAVRHGLHTALLAYAPLLNDIIDRFVKFQEERNFVINDELLWILLEEEECNMAEHVDVPKVLGDIFESVIGAIYLDTGKDLVKVWEIVYALMNKEIETFSSNVPKQPIRVIHETPGAKPEFTQASTIEGTNTVMVSLYVFDGGKKKCFHGFGGNKKEAKCAAAKQALKYLRCKK
ncbi:endoribonuclease Dicer [Orussus abietinus]|uniref:endoribonuclease Dicer n=1 Tax=Orussus abietinus TaxID=222816 RepID=UPI0006255A5B|nr:endoribonuclease Dicer [Orussus abietinus]XP_012287235.1 endoribonuclease Dicer [Orussus abietinus]